MTSGVEKAEGSAATARKYYQQGEFEAAARSFARAEDAYNASGMEARAAEMANNRAVALLQLSRHRQAYQALADTPEVFERAGEQQLAAQAYGNLAAALEGLDQWNEAEINYRRALELFEAVGDRESVAHTAKAYSRLQLRHGQALEAVTTMQGALSARGDPSLRERFLRWLLQLPSRLLGR